MTQELSAVDRLIALAGVTRVEKHKRTTKTGKVVNVESHLRSVRSMPNMDLFSEYNELQSKTDPQSKNRKTQVVNEIRKRQSDGSWQASKEGGASEGNQTRKTDSSQTGAGPKSLTEGLNNADLEADSAAVRKLQQDMQRQPGQQAEAPQRKPKTVPGKGALEGENVPLDAPDVEASDDQRASDGADRVAARAADAEVSASSALKKVIDNAGGSFFGWEHRLKKKDSLARKIKDRFSDPKRFEGVEGEERWKAAEAAMGDSLRYTVVAKAEDYTRMADDALDELRKEGHTVAKIDNFWGDGGSYFGTHADMVSPDGLKWELQFHTPDSMIRKEASHFWYDFYRDRSLPPMVRDQARARSAGAWTGLERPKGWSEFGTQVANPTEDTHVGGGPGAMDSKSVPPSVTKGADGVKTVSWGGWKFRQDKDQWVEVKRD